MSTPFNNRIIIFDYLRIIAIILVVFCHYLYVGNTQYSLTIKVILGVIGNGIFLFISGYLISARHYISGVRQHSIKLFVVSRFFRIYPFYWVAMIFYIICAFYFWKLHYNLPTLIVNFLGLQAIFCPQIVPSISIFWFIGTILLCYFCYILLSKITETTNGIIFYSLLLLGLLLIIRIKFGIFSLQFIEYYPLFILGVFCHREKIFENKQFKPLSLLAFAGLLTSLFVILYTNIPLGNSIEISFYSILVAILVNLLRYILIFCFIYNFFILFSNFSIHIKEDLLLKMSITTYAVYLFHSALFMPFDGIRWNIDIIEGIVYNFILIVAGLPFLFTVCYYFQKYFDVNNYVKQS